MIYHIMSIVREKSLYIGVETAYKKCYTKGVV